MEALVVEAFGSKCRAIVWLDLKLKRREMFVPALAMVHIQKEESRRDPAFKFKRRGA